MPRDLKDPSDCFLVGNGLERLRLDPTEILMLEDREAGRQAVGQPAQPDLISYPNDHLRLLEQRLSEASLLLGREKLASPETGEMGAA